MAAPIIHLTKNGVKKRFHGGVPGRTCPSKEGLPKRPCQVCGHRFSPQRQWNKYCTAKCRDASKHLRMREREPLMPKRSKPNAPWGTATCPVCAADFKLTRSGKKYCSFKCSRLRMQRNWKNKNRADGHCYSCKEVPMENSTCFCRKHWLVQAAWRAGLRGSKAGEAVEEMLIRQNYRCAYTGIRLVLGVNASLDHIKPRLQHPELLGQISNLEWVDESVNRSKGNMSRERFIALCREVDQHHRR
jgi:hypothetical protein